MAQATTKQQVLNGINKLTLQTNKHRQYTHNAILLLQKEVLHVLISQFDPSKLGKGMTKLLNDGKNLLNLVKLTDVIMAGLIIKVAKMCGQAHNNDWQTVLSTISARTEAQEECHWRK